MNNIFLTNKSYFKEIKKCRKDIVYFVQKYCKYSTFDNHTTNITLTKKKKEFLRALAKNYNRKIIALGYRQSGKTMLEIVFALWKMCFFPASTIAFVSSLKINASSVYGKLMNMASLLPKWMAFEKCGNVNFSSQMGNFTNRSRFISTWDPEFLRGLSINVLFVDELAFFHETKFKNTIRTIIPFFDFLGCKIVLVSSAYKANGLFYEIWKQANSDNPDGWIPFEFSISEKMTINGLKQFVERTNMSGETLKMEFLNIFRN